MYKRVMRFHGRTDFFLIPGRKNLRMLCYEGKAAFKIYYYVARHTSFFQAMLFRRILLCIEVR